MGHPFHSKLHADVWSAEFNIRLRHIRRVTLGFGRRQNWLSHGMVRGIGLFRDVSCPGHPHSSFLLVEPSEPTVALLDSVGAGGNIGPTHVSAGRAIRIRISVTVVSARLSGDIDIVPHYGGGDEKAVLPTLWAVISPICSETLPVRSSLTRDNLR